MTKCKLGEVEFSAVEQESASYSNDVTSKPVENGVDVSDHVERKPITLSLSGVVTDSQAAQKIKQLRRYSLNGDLLTYRGRNSFNNVVIKNFNSEHVVVGFSFSMTIQEVRIAQRRLFVVDTPQTSDVKEQGLKVVSER